MDKEIILMDYMSIWFWNILSIIFLCFSLSFFIVKNIYPPALGLSISFIVLFGLCQGISMKRKKIFYDKLSEGIKNE